MFLVLSESGPVQIIKQNRFLTFDRSAYISDRITKKILLISVDRMVLFCNQSDLLTIQSYHPKKFIDFCRQSGTFLINLICLQYNRTNVCNIMKYICHHMKFICFTLGTKQIEFFFAASRQLDRSRQFL